MITLITGVPGSGKTAAAVDLIISEYAGRLLYVDGLADLTLDHQPLDVMQWPADVPDGALIVVDEVQRKWRSRGPASKLPESVAQLETHRHRGLDFIIITQGPRLLDSNVRALVGRHVHIRDTGFMGRWAYEWPECNAELNWSKCQNKRRYKLPKKVFNLYKSASLHNKPVRKIPPMLYIVGALLVSVAGLLYYFKSNFNPSGKPVLAEAQLPPILPGQTLPPESSAVPGQTAKPSFIDDRVDFMPRVSNVPESAPAYDHLRVIVNMPQIAGGLCTKSGCSCFSQQATKISISHDECKAWMDNPVFDHYRPPAPQQAIIPAAPAAPVGASLAGTPSAPAQTVAAPSSSEFAAPRLFDGVSNPYAEARPPRIFPPGSIQPI